MTPAQLKTIAAVATERARYATATARQYTDEAGDDDNATRWLVHASAMIFVQKVCEALCSIDAPAGEE